MRISHRYKFIFFANPKTGSESVRDLLDDYSDICGAPLRRTTKNNPFYTHMRPIEARAAFENLGWKFDEYYRFVFVRNPWERLVSIYDMMWYGGTKPNESFEHWLRETKTDGNGGGSVSSAPWLKFGTYTLENFAGDGRGGLLVNDVFRLEDIAQVPDRLKARGIPLPADTEIPHINRTVGKPNRRTFYSDELIALVGERYAKEIQQFGYKPPPPGSDPNLEADATENAARKAAGWTPSGPVTGQTGLSGAFRAAMQSKRSDLVPRAMSPETETIDGIEYRNVWRRGDPRIVKTARALEMRLPLPSSVPEDWAQRLAVTAHIGDELVALAPVLAVDLPKFRRVCARFWLFVAPGYGTRDIRVPMALKVHEVLRQHALVELTNFGGTMTELESSRWWPPDASMTMIGYSRRHRPLFVRWFDHVKQVTAT